jgi:hypothetical protein
MSFVEHKLGIVLNGACCVINGILDLIEVMHLLILWIYYYITDLLLLLLLLLFLSGR